MGRIWFDVVAAAASGRQRSKRHEVLTRMRSRQTSNRTLSLDRYRSQHRLELSFGHGSALASTHANQEHQGPPGHQPQPTEDASTRTGLVLQRIRESDVRSCQTGHVSHEQAELVGAIADTRVTFESRGWA